MRPSPYALLLALSLIACGDAGGGDTPTPTSPDGARDAETPTPLPTPRPGEGFQIKVGGYTLQPGEDATTCTFINGYVEEVQAVNGSMALQRQGGHHLSVYQAEAFEPDGTRPCYSNDSGMESWTLIAGNFKQGHHAHYPDDVAIALDPTKTLIINAHHINTGTESIVADDAVNIYTIPVDQVEHWLGSYLMLNFDIDVPPGGRYDTEATCPIPFDMETMVIIGHMHEWGEQIDYSIERADGSSEPLYSGLPTVDDPTVGGMTTFFEDPLSLRRGDKLRWRCRWFNDTDAPLGWPTEMCAVIFTYYPAAETQLQCFKSVGSLQD